MDCVKRSAKTMANRLNASLHVRCGASTSSPSSSSSCPDERGARARTTAGRGDLGSDARLFVEKADRNVGDDENEELSDELQKQRQGPDISYRRIGGSRHEPLTIASFRYEKNAGM
jgi:hypothetical protein